MLEKLAFLNVLVNDSERIRNVIYLSRARVGVNYFRS